MNILDLMTVLQNRWYNGLTAGLGLSPSLFQISLPASPIPPSDTSLWTFQDALPPDSLTFNRAVLGGDTFFGEYAAVAGELEFPQADFAKDIGEQNYLAWMAYLATVQPPPTPEQLPALFYEWASLYAPDAVAAGVSDLTEMALIDAGREALQPYLGSGAKPVDFHGTWADLLRRLGASPGASLSFDSSTTSPVVSGTWTGGLNTGVAGLWTGAASTTRLSRKFAVNRVRVAAAFQAWAVWASTPGGWYDSSLLNTAYRCSGTPPWPADADPTWAEELGPGGSLDHLTASLVVVDGVDATISSGASFDADSQELIRERVPLGLWPFYAPSGGPVANAVTFDASGRMTIKTTIRKGSPVVLGANVLPISQYLGGGG